MDTRCWGPRTEGCVCSGAKAREGPRWSCGTAEVVCISGGPEGTHKRRNPVERMHGVWTREGQTGGTNPLQRDKSEGPHAQRRSRRLLEKGTNPGAGSGPTKGREEDTKQKGYLCGERGGRPKQRVPRSESCRWTVVVPLFCGAPGVCVPAGAPSKTVGAGQAPVPAKGCDAEGEQGFRIWLILPVVICFVQGLSHAYLSANGCRQWICVWLLTSAVIYVIECGWRQDGAQWDILQNLVANTRSQGSAMTQNC